MKLNCWIAGVVEHIFCSVLSSQTQNVVAHFYVRVKSRLLLATSYKIMSINMELYESIASAAI